MGDAHRGGKLTREVPAKTKRAEFDWVRLNFVEMTQGYRKIRARFRYKGTSCWWCKRHIQDGEQIALASVSKRGVGNKTLCDGCAREAIACTQATDQL